MNSLHRIEKMGGMQERCRKREKTGGASHIGRTGEIGESVCWIGKAARGGRLSVESTNAGELNLLSGMRGGTDGSSFLLAVSGKPVAVPEILVELAGKLSSAWAENGAATFKEEDCDQVSLRRV